MLSKTYKFAGKADKSTEILETQTNSVQSLPFSELFMH